MYTRTDPLRFLQQVEREKHTNDCTCNQSFDQKANQPTKVKIPFVKREGLELGPQCFITTNVIALLLVCVFILFFVPAFSHQYRQTSSKELRLNYRSRAASSILLFKLSWRRNKVVSWVAGLVFCGVQEFVSSLRNMSSDFVLDLA